jgi:[acyl-carrier-protein] S-malonyltransferase
MSIKYVALFPGQGSQHVGMAKDLLENFKIARETFEEASDAARLNIRDLCLNGPDADLTLTENTQPCLLTASVAAFRVAQIELGFVPSIVAGHSLGEYSALVAAGAIPLGTAAAWVRERGRAMQVAVPAGQGTMAAVLGMEDSMISKLCEAATAAAKAKRAQGENEELTVEAIVEPANFNAPGQIVIAGSTDAVGEAIALIKAGGDFAGGKAIPLSVSAPFHCKLMRGARDKMADIFSSTTVKVHAPTCPYVPNRTARITQEAGVVFELLVEQVDNPVLWKQSMTGLLEQNYLAYAEFGPGKVLSGLMKRIGQPVGKTATTSNISDSATLKLFDAAMKAAEKAAAEKGTAHV